MDTKGRFDFRGGGSISQRRGFFVEKGHFHSPFRSCEMGGTMLQNGTRVPKGCFAAAKYPEKWGFGSEIGIFYASGISQPFHNCEMRLLCCEMALVC